MSRAPGGKAAASGPSARAATPSGFPISGSSGYSGIAASPRTGRPPPARPPGPWPTGAGGARAASRWGSPAARSRPGKGLLKTVPVATPARSPAAGSGSGRATSPSGWRSRPSRRRPGQPRATSSQPTWGGAAAGHQRPDRGRAPRRHRRGEVAAAHHRGQLGLAGLDQQPIPPDGGGQAEQAQPHSTHASTAGQRPGRSVGPRSSPARPPPGIHRRHPHLPQIASAGGHSGRPPSRQRYGPGPGRVRRGW
jgi:hypothetical protein